MAGVPGWYSLMVVALVAVTFVVTQARIESAMAEAGMYAVQPSLRGRRWLRIGCKAAFVGLTTWWGLFAAFPFNLALLGTTFFCMASFSIAASVDRLRRIKLAGAFFGAGSPEFKVVTLFNSLGVLCASFIWLLVCQGTLLELMVRDSANPMDRYTVPLIVLGLCGVMIFGFLALTYALNRPLYRKSLDRLAGLHPDEVERLLRGAERAASGPPLPPIREEDVYVPESEGLRPVGEEPLAEIRAALLVVYRKEVQERGQRSRFMEEWISRPLPPEPLSDEEERNLPLFYATLCSPSGSAAMETLFREMMVGMRGRPYEECGDLLQGLAIVQRIAATAHWKYHWEVGPLLMAFARGFDRLDVDSERRRLFDSASMTSPTSP